MKRFSRICTRGKIVAAAGLVATLGALAPNVALADDAPAAALTAAQAGQQSAPVASNEAAATVSSAADASAVTAATAVQANADDSATQSAPAASAGQTESGNQAEPLSASVAKIGANEYATLDDAIAAAKDGATIELTQDAKIASTNVVSKRLIIKGNGHTVSVTTQPGTEKGFLDISGSLTFDDAKVSFANPSFWSVVIRNGGELSFENGSEAKFTENGIYTYGAGASINVDASTLTFDGTSYTALMNEYQNGLGYASINVTGGSNLTVKNVANGNNGITGFVVNVKDSQLHVDDNANQGLVRCTTTLDNSTATISGNDTGITGYRGLDNLTLKNASRLDMVGNKSAGIFLWGGNVDVQSGTTLRITGTGADAEQGKYTGAICAYYYGDLRSHVTLADGATVNLTNNPVGAINNGGEMYVGANTTITGNGANAENGGGILNTGKITVADGARLYNNHAKTSGDDICNTAATADAACGTIDFAATGDDWQLDSELGNCGHAIDGWYDDAADARWSAHGSGKHVESALEGSYNTPLALKAAHGLVRVDYKYVGDAPEGAQLPDSDESLEAGMPYNSRSQAGVDGWTFDGWYADEACTQRWADGTALPSSMTLYGKWTKVPDESAQPSEPQQPSRPSSATPAKGDGKALPQTGDASMASIAALAAGGVAVVAAGIASRRRSK